MSLNKRTKKSLVLTLGLVVGGLYTSAGNIYAAEKEVVRAEKLNVRKGPSINDDRIASLDRGMVVEILETSNGWNKIKTSDNKEGWVSGEYTTKEKATVKVNELNIRKGPSAKEDKIGSLENGSVIEILEDNDNWYKIKLEDNKTGWISAEYVITETQAKEQVEMAKSEKVQSTVKEEKSEAVVSNTTTNESLNTVSKSEPVKEETNASSSNKNGRLMTVNASAYSGHSTTSTGTTPKWGTIAVDPSVIPYGTRVYIPKFDMVFTAEDCGSAIKGNKIDIFMNSESECNTFGRQNIEIQILG
ncbi:SH3 domain-containing protein [Paraclostridium sordellii]|uniref:Hydrolase n=1 Tax=Paraclostridium sordellii TaxID=1505 RepID=A0A0C7R3U2_PARSO|nr:SH3 domain-containing protein [Paeniclostridium sordellii]QYE98919.1 SH3 domain-containing protein [Paeniclostridium sordellii]CEN77692.1 hydrolase [[Clostridium] sordellii] [Paeniclostridium sordellii]CEQ02779.1 hydrolase [[Clostridium] sordellii] [Paeniclostridium sordellii]